MQKGIVKDKNKKEIGGDYMVAASATEVQNNFGKFLQLVQDGDEVVILKNGKEVARMISYEKSVSFLTDSLIGVIDENVDDKEIRQEIVSRYESFD